MNTRRNFLVGVALLVIGSVFLFIHYAHSENSDVVISEICPTGCGSSSGHQWIELFNKGEAPVDLVDWRFWEDETAHKITLSESSVQEDTIIEPGEYAIIAQNDLYFFQDYPNVTSTVFDSTWGTLHGDGEEIGIKWGAGSNDFVERFSYSISSALVDKHSFERKDFETLPEDITNWDMNPDGSTPGEQNYWFTDDEEPGGDDEDDNNGDGQEEGDDESNGESSSSTISNVVINEFMVDPANDDGEWIELYNPTSTAFDLSGFELYDTVGKIATISSTIEPLGFLVIELSSSKLNNDGDSIILKDAQGNILDEIIYGSDVSAPKDGNTLARFSDGIDTDTVQDFKETTTPTKGFANSITAPVVNPPSSGGGGGGGSSTPAPTPQTTQEIQKGDVVINELVSDPSDGADEFVELFNKTSQTINVSGWWVEDGSETKTAIAGSVLSHGHYVIEKPKGSLNNTGDLIILFDASGKEIDRVSYGLWNDGNLSDNALIAEDPMSLSRKVDGQDSDYDLYDFAVTKTITKGKKNVVTLENNEQIVSGGKIIINEIYPNPPGSDNDEEFIELKNNGSETVSLKDWKLGDSSAKQFTITQGDIAPSGYIVFKRTQTGIALNNSGGEEVKLFLPNSTLADSVRFEGSAEESTSYSRRDDGGWAWTSSITSGSSNIIEGKSAAPLISIDVDTHVAVGESVSFDASDSTDPDGDVLAFEWDFGDGEDGEGSSIEHVYEKEGTFTVNVTVSDGKQESKKKVIITVKRNGSFVGGSSGDFGSVIISEIFPNPEGSDTTEFIELYNPSDTETDISGMKLDDEEGGSRAYIFPENTILLPHEYSIFAKQDTKLSLNNTSDAVRLLAFDNTVMSEVPYDDVEEGSSYVKNSEGQWVWTGTVTPGEENIVMQKIKTTKSSSKSVKGTKVKSVIETTLEKVRDNDIGDMVKVVGTVAVEPGVLGSQFFYIVGSPGIQVYMYKKDFPKIVVGDKVEVTGELSEASGDLRIKTSTKADIVKIEHAGEPQSKVVEITDIGEPYEGWLVQVNGEITEIKSSYMYVDDGTEEVKVYFKRGAGISKQTLQEGDLVTVNGLVHQTKSGYELLPRSMTDIVKTGVAESFVQKQEETQKENATDIAEKYLTATAGGLTAIFVGLLGKTKGEKIKTWGNKIILFVRKRIKKY
ncbi:MAG: lamin tail domain-containing protein [Candidatus Magasanikbacteria bacterium]